MTLVEKRVSIEKKSYQNMAIRLRKNFKAFYRKRLLEQRIKNYRNFLKKYRSGFYNLKKKKLKLKRKKKYLKRKVISFKSKRRLLKRLYFRGYKKRFFFSYLKMRMESIRLKNYLFKFRWRNKRSRWISKYRRGLKRVYYSFLVNKLGFAIRHYKSSYLTNYLSSLEKIRPLIYYRVIYIGGKKYRIPVLLSLSKSYLVAIR